jgi:hypothetical protein
MKTYGRLDAQIHIFLILALVWSGELDDPAVPLVHIFLDKHKSNGYAMLIENFATLSLC